MNLKTYLEIKTQEAVTFRLLLASPFLRFLAWLVDVFVEIAIIWVLILFFTHVIAIIEGVGTALFIILVFLITTFYPILLEWFWRGKTLGKKIFGLRVMDVQGLKLHFSQIVVRNLLRFVDFFPALYATGGMISLLSPLYQRLGDYAANTVVVRQIQVLSPDLSLIKKEKYNSLRAHPTLCARLRQNILPEEAGLALEALLRRETLAPQASLEIFDELALFFKSRCKFPEETLETLSSEQFVRNVVEVLFE